MRQKTFFNIFLCTHNLRNAITTKEMQFKRVIVYLSDFFPLFKYFTNQTITLALVDKVKVSLSKIQCPKHCSLF